MSTLKEIQNCQLDILKTVVGICDKNNIKYYLACGTFLGAVRHKGFIPWDDDVDIYMEYNDLIKFKELCQKELPKKYFYQDFATDKGASWIFTKIRANDTYMPEESVEKRQSITYHQGVWIDIFPLLSASDKEEFVLKQINYIFKYQHTLPLYLDLKKYKFTSFKHKVLAFMNNLKYDIQLRFYKSKFESLQSGNSDKVIIMSNAYWQKGDKKGIEAALKKTIKKDLLVTCKYPFEDTKFTGFKDYDTYLTNEYGSDYMTPRKWTHIQDYSDVIVNK